MSKIQFQSEAIQVAVECLFKAQRLYGLSDEWREGIQIKFQNKGRTAGTASVKRGQMILSFNEQMLCAEHRDRLLNDTIPHEIAHLVCFSLPQLGKNHDRGWKRVCIQLGGNGERCHDLPLARARKTRKRQRALYVVGGKELPVGLTQHKRIQSGTRSYRCSQGSVKPDNFTGRIVEV